MNGQLVNRETGEVQSIKTYRLTDQDITTLVGVGIIPLGTPKPTVEMFAKYCSETGLSPFKRQVHLVKRGSKQGDRYTIQTGIDGYRSMANQTGLYAGNDDYQFDEGLNEYQMVKANRKNPVTATATVYKLVNGVRCPFAATARWEEYVQTYFRDGQTCTSPFWEKMPFLMLGKCAEALAFRKAFPDELSGVYTDEEMQQAAKYEVIEEVKPEPIQIKDPYGFEGEDKFYPRNADPFEWRCPNEKWWQRLLISGESKGLTHDSLLLHLEDKRKQVEPNAPEVTSMKDLNYFQYRWLGNFIQKYNGKVPGQTDLPLSKEEIITRGEKAAQEL